MTAATLAVPALVLLYVLKLRRRPVRVSSTLLWQRAVEDQQANVPFRLLRADWVMVLQLLGLVLLLLAMGRPALNWGTGTSERVVLIVDRSASMSARDGDAAGATRLDQARRRAERVLDELVRSGESPAFAVITLSAQPRLVCPMTRDFAAIRRAIAAITPSDQPGDLAAALDLAAGVLASATSETTRPQAGLVMLFSDGGFPPGQAGTLPGAAFQFHLVGTTHADERMNGGIVALAARRDWADPATVRLFARLANTHARPVIVPLVLRLNGQEIDRRTIEIPGRTHGRTETPPGAEGDTPAPRRPGTAPVTFAFQAAEGGVASLTIETSDLLDSDNTAATVLAPVAPPRVLVVIPDGPPGDRPAEESPERGGGTPARSPDWLITDIVREMRVPMRVVSAGTYEDMTREGAVAEWDVIVFDRVTPARLPPVPSLSFGAGLGDLMQPNEDRQEPGAIQPPSDAASRVPQSSAARGTYVLSWRRTHPLLRHVTLDTVYVARTIPMRVAASTIAGEALTVTELARGASGPLILLLEHGSLRRVVVAFEPARSTWPLTHGFPIFVASAIEYLALRGQETAGRAFTTVQPADLQVPAGTERVVLDGPVRLEHEVRGAETGPAGWQRVTVGVIERAGLYRVVSPAPTDASQATLAVNLADEHESALDIVGTLRVAGEEARALPPGHEPRELWPACVALALGLLMAEWFLSAWRMRL